MTSVDVYLFILDVPSCSFEVWTCSVWQIFKYLKTAIMCSSSSLSLCVNISNFSRNSQIIRISIVSIVSTLLVVLLKDISRICSSQYIFVKFVSGWLTVFSGVFERVYIHWDYCSSWHRYEIAFKLLRKHQWVHICLPGKCSSL